jgi:hypothetical protein
MNNKRKVNFLNVPKISKYKHKLNIKTSSYANNLWLKSMSIPIKNNFNFDDFKKTLESSL